MTNPDVSWNVSLSPIRQASGSIQTFCLVRFSCLSSHTWNRELDVIAVKVWQDMELTSIGVFLPVEEEEEREEKVKFKLFSSKGQMMYEQEEDVAELYATDLDNMGEMKFTRPVELAAHRKYFLVMKMSGLTCSAGEGGSYLHCLQTEKGGVQVAFETPEKDDLGGKIGLPFIKIILLNHFRGVLGRCGESYQHIQRPDSGSLPQGGGGGQEVKLRFC